MAFFKLYFLAAAVISVSLAQSESTNSSKVDVVVYYESLCPDSMAFFTKQLVPTMSTGLKNNINLTLIPFGRANMTKGDNTTFNCHHGPKECVGNKNQACIISGSLKSNLDSQLKLLDCLMMPESKTADVYPVQECAKKANLDSSVVDEIVMCANSSKGDQLLETMGDKTNSFMKPLTNVPLVTINGVQDKNAIADLKTVVCSKLTNSTQVSECKSGKNGASTYQNTAPFLAIIAAVTLARL